MFSILLSSYRDTRESLGELKNDVETLACDLCSHSFFEFSQVKSRLNGEMWKYEKSYERVIKIGTGKDVRLRANTWQSKG